MTKRTDHPRQIVRDARGFYWRDYTDIEPPEVPFYSMPPVTEDNEPVEVEAIYVLQPASPEPERESCCSKENPHRAIPTITDRTRIARHWFDEAAVFPATKIYAASDLDAGPADDGRLRAGRLMYAVGHRDPGLAVLAIEAELRASLAADYRKMHGYPTTGATNDAVLALIEGSDPASPAPATEPRLTAEQWWYALSSRYRKALDAATSMLEHTSDHHATDARLTLLAATDPEGNDPTYPFPDLLATEPRSLSGPLDVEGAVAEMVGVESSIDEAMRRAKRVTATLAGIARLATDPSAPEQTDD